MSLRSTPKRNGRCLSTFQRIDSPVLLSDTRLSKTHQEVPLFRFSSCFLAYTPILLTPLVLMMIYPVLVYYYVLEYVIRKYVVLLLLLWSATPKKKVNLAYSITFTTSPLAIACSIDRRRDEQVALSSTRKGWFFSVLDHYSILLQAICQLLLHPDFS